MLQGTGSSVGKSVLCAALCRIFMRRGLSVAPFKAQNMSNNAFVTAAGGEISRAQAVQAEAAGVSPTVEMNPILLKPEGEFGSQVVLLGRVWGRLRAADYLRRKALFWTTVEESLYSLLRRFDVVVVEGAGSPAEVNLKAGDIVNMRIAQAADASVFLVGDIDRGGVFASLIGTLELLEPDERDRVRGLIINRFRGDQSLLEPGLRFLEQRAARPVLGVVPYLPDLGLAEEDAATLETDSHAQPGRANRDAATPLNIAALRLPRLANYDDLDPLQRAGAEVHWIDDPSHFGQPDLIVLPGSKNTAADLDWVHRRGLGAALVELVDRGTPVLGLCGGYQMLGESLEDPEGVESDQPATAGLGLLPIKTVLRREKTTRQSRGRVKAGRGLFAGADGVAVQGYEIHVGETFGPGEPLLELEAAGRAYPDGRSARSGWVVGTYLHGLLSNAAVVEALRRNLAARRASPGPCLPGLPARGDPYDRLADHVEAALDLPRILSLAGLPDLVAR